MDLFDSIKTGAKENVLENENDMVKDKKSAGNTQALSVIRKNKLLISVFGIVLVGLVVLFSIVVSRPEPIEVEGNMLTIFGPFEGEDIEIVLPEFWSGQSASKFILLSPNHKLKEGQRLRLVSHVSYYEGMSDSTVYIDDEVLEWTEAIELPTYSIDISWDGNVVEGHQQKTSLDQVGTEVSERVIRNNVELPLKKIVAADIRLEGTFNELEMVKAASVFEDYRGKRSTLEGEFQSLETLEIESYDDISIQGKFPRLHSIIIYSHDTAEGQDTKNIDINGEFPLLEDMELIGGYTRLYGEFPALKRIRSWVAEFKTPSVIIQDEITFDSLTEIAGWGYVQLLLYKATSYPKLEKIECYTVDFRVELAKLYNGDKYWLEDGDAINIPENVKIYAREIMSEMPVLKEVTVFRNVTADYDVDREALLRLADEGIIALNYR